MKVLWFACTPSLYDGKIISGGWVASLQRIIMKYQPDVELAVAFTHSDTIFKTVRDGVTYYPLNKGRNLKERLQLLLDYDAEWRQMEPQCRKVIEDFAPDVIHCFGSEWPYGVVAEFTKVPVIVHMQGFLNIYHLSGSMVYRTSDYYRYYHYNPFSIFHYWYRSTKSVKADNREKRVMKCCRYYLGRTEWDKNIVKYFSPNAEYFYCAEAIRPEIMHSPLKWHYQERKKMRIVTISSASGLKGNELLLRTATLLTNMGFDFEWRVAGGMNSFKFSEWTYGLDHNKCNIKLLGIISAEEVTKELSEADVYVHTAIIDNSPNSLCEAQLIGVPVLTTFVGGIPQLVEDGKTGIFYPYNEPYTLAFQLKNLFQNSELMKQLSSNEIEESHRRHDEKAIALRLIDIYQSIIEKSKT